MFSFAGELIFIRGTSQSRATTILLRGANEFMLDEMDRSMHDVLCVVKRVLESKSLVGCPGCMDACLWPCWACNVATVRAGGRGSMVARVHFICAGFDARPSRLLAFLCSAPLNPSRASPPPLWWCGGVLQVAGGGAVEAALSIYLESFATTLGTREQLAIHEFSQALLVIPKTLAVNAALDATEVVSQLCVFHNTAQKVVRMRAEGRMRAGRVCVCCCCCC